MKTAILRTREDEPLWVGNAPAVHANEQIMVPDGARHLVYTVAVRMVVIHGDEPAQYLTVHGKGTPVNWA